MILSPCQEKAISTFDAFLVSDEKEFILSGFSGVGKTTVTEMLIKKLHDRNVFLKDVLNVKGFDLLLTATTNKAVRVLYNIVDKMNLPVTVSTIYSALKLKVVQDYSTGKERITTTNETTFFNNTIVFIDEASYGDTVLQKLVRNYFNSSCKIVWIGDKDQLLSIGYTSSPILDDPTAKFFTHMVTPQRNQGTINLLAHEYRHVLYGGNWPVIAPSAEIEIISGKDFKQKVMDMYTSTQYSKDSDYVRILGWTNSRIQEYNQFVRTLYTSTEQYVADEYLTTNNVVFGNGNSILLTSDTTLKIKDASEILYDEYNVPYQEMSFYGLNIILKVALEFSKVTSILKTFAKNKDWYEYFSYKNKFADLRPSHASTIHKAQGSTYQNVFIDLNNIGLNNNEREVARLLYVGISRAKEKLYVYGSLPDKYKG